MKIRGFLLGLMVFLGCLGFSQKAWCDEKSAHWALRGFAEIGMGALFGAAVGGGALVSGVLIDRRSIKTTLIVSAALYPAGVAGGAILGGYLTDSKSTYWEPFVGAYAGALVADLTAYYLANDYPTLSAVLVITLPILSTLMVMEFSHLREKHGKKGKQSEFVIMPLSYGFSF